MQCQIILNSDTKEPTKNHTFTMSNNITKAFLIAFFSAISFITSAATYYVSPTGTSSASGSISDPINFATAIGKSLVAGDSLIFRGGTYSFSSSQSFSKSGVAGNLIHYVAYQSEVPIFDFRTQVYGSNSRGLNLSGNYMHVKGITVQGAGDNGFYVTGSNLFIEQCTARWNCDSGFQLKTGSNNYILNCDSYENFDYESSGSIGGNADGFADKQYTNTGTNTYKGCRSWSNSDDGWDSYEKTGNTVYDSCWCYNMAPAQYDMTNHIRYATDKAYVDGFTNHIIPNVGNGNGFKMGGNYYANNATAHHCISVGNKVKGFDQNHNNGIMTVSNCTSYNNNPNYGYSDNSYGTLIVKNCVSLSSKGSNSFGCKSVTQAYNSWNTGFTCASTDFTSLDYTQMLNDRQSDGSLPEITLLHLQSTSGMIDKGTNVGFSFSGLAPDLGAFEYNSLTTVTTPSSSTSDISVYYTATNKEIAVRGFINAVEVYQLTGQKIYAQTYSSESLSIRAGNWTKGIYLVRVVSQNGILTTKKILVD